LILDDTTLDKPYAQKIDLVHRHWSGKHHRVVSGINLLTLLWSDGKDALPCDYRLFDKPVDGLTKNAHFRAMLDTAKARGFQPQYVAFDSWYSSLANLKAIRAQGWHWLTRLKANRQVNPDGMGNRALAECAIREAGTRMHPREITLASAPPAWGSHPSPGRCALLMRRAGVVGMHR
jgi:putative transposase